MGMSWLHTSFNGETTALASQGSYTHSDLMCCIMHHMHIPPTLIYGCIYSNWGLAFML